MLIVAPLRIPLLHGLLLRITLLGSITALLRILRLTVSLLLRRILLRLILRILNRLLTLVVEHPDGIHPRIPLSLVLVPGRPPSDADGRTQGNLEKTVNLVYPRKGEGHELVLQLCIHIGHREVYPLPRIAGALTLAGHYLTDPMKFSLPRRDCIYY